MMRMNERCLARRQVLKAELEAHTAEGAHNLKIALERKRLADERLKAAFDIILEDMRIVDESRDWYFDQRYRRRDSVQTVQ